MSRVPNVAAQYTRLLARWPVDKLRPENLHFQRILQNRLQAATQGGNDADADLASQANAAYLLLDNTFASRYTLSSRLMKPASRPEMYKDLERELEEGPQRGFLAYAWKRMTSMVRRQ